MIQLEHGFEGPFKTGIWRATNASTGSQTKIAGKQASLISLILSGYVLKPEFQPLDAFTKESLEGALSGGPVHRSALGIPALDQAAGKILNARKPLTRDEAYAIVHQAYSAGFAAGKEVHSD